MTWRSSTI